MIISCLLPDGINLPLRRLSQLLVVRFSFCLHQRFQQLVQLSRIYLIDLLLVHILLYSIMLTKALMTRFRASTPMCRSTRSRSWALSSLRHFRHRCNLLSRVVRLVTIYGHLFNKLLRWISRWSPSAVGSVHLEWSSWHNPLHAIDANYVSMILQKPPTSTNCTIRARWQRVQVKLLLSPSYGASARQAKTPNKPWGVKRNWKMQRPQLAVK